MKNLLRKKPAGSATEQAITDLQARRDAIEKQLAGARSAADDAAAERRAILVEGDLSDTAAMTRAEEGCRTASARVSSLAEAAKLISEKLADAEEQLAADRAQQERDQVAAALDRTAAAAAAGAAQLQRSLAGVGSVFAQLVAALEETAPIHGANGRLSPHQVAALILAEAVAAAAGADVFTAANDRGSISHGLRRGRVSGSRVLFEGDPEDWQAPAGADGATEAILALTHQLAAAIRTGDAPPSLPERYLPPEPKFRLRARGSALIYVTRPALYRIYDGAPPALLDPGVTSVRLPVAEAAVAARVALDMATDEGRALADRDKDLRARQKGTRAGFARAYPMEERLDLGILNPDEIAEAEMAEQRAQWLAKHGRAA